ncbi:MAG: hypothetical protein U5Q44_07320 [Dehalococcoidia bacterium]|nr:hypothetical protein [Dehalococcoidia bacterium]
MDRATITIEDDDESNIAITKSADVASALPGETVNYTIEVTNAADTDRRPPPKDASSFRHAAGWRRMHGDRHRQQRPTRARPAIPGEVACSDSRVAPIRVERERLSIRAIEATVDGDARR